MQISETERAKETREKFKFKDIENKLAKYGYRLYDEIGAGPPELFSDCFMFLYQNSDGEACAIKTPEEHIEFGSGLNLVEFSFEDIRKDSWRPPSNQK